MNAHPDVLTTHATPHRGGGCCRLCSKDIKYDFVDLGMSPLCESFLSADRLDGLEPYFPLHAYVCDSCFLVQLKEYVKPDEIFREYAYFSSYSTSWVEHARKYCVMIKERLGLGADSLVVELASNDGYLLQHFLPLGVPVLGIEPAENVASAAIDKGVPTRTEFFGVRLADQLASEGRKAELIVGNNVLAQVPDLNDFVAGIARSVEARGRRYARVPAHRQADRGEPVRHDLPRAFLLLLADHDRAFGCAPRSQGDRRRGDCRPMAGRCASIWRFATSQRERERQGRRVARGGGQRRPARDPDLPGVRRAGEAHQARAPGVPDRSEDGQDCGFAAMARRARATRFSTTAASVPISSTSPSTAIPTSTAVLRRACTFRSYPVEAIAEAKPDYILILPWNLKNEIVEQMRFIKDWGAKFIVPIPEVAIIDPKELRP